MEKTHANRKLDFAFSLKGQKVKLKLSELLYILYSKKSARGRFIYVYAYI